MRNSELNLRKLAAAMFPITVNQRTSHTKKSDPLVRSTNDPESVTMRKLAAAMFPIGIKYRRGRRVGGVGILKGGAEPLPLSAFLGTFAA